VSLYRYNPRPRFCPLSVHPTPTTAFASSSFDPRVFFLRLPTSRPLFPKWATVLRCPGRGVKRRGFPRTATRLHPAVGERPKGPARQSWRGVAVSRCLGLLPDGEAGARRRRSCVGVQREAWQDRIMPGCASSRDSTYPPVSASLSPSHCGHPAFQITRCGPLVPAPPPAWSKQIKDRLSCVASCRYPRLPATPWELAVLGSPFSRWFINACHWILIIIARCNRKCQGGGEAASPLAKFKLITLASAVQVPQKHRRQQLPQSGQATFVSARSKVGVTGRGATSFSTPQPGC
jgi:hypothetical protein